MRKVALFFAPHPDDVEFGCSFYYMNLLEQGYRVIQVVMTDGAFGTTNPEFKGKRLVKIRMKELDKATTVFENATKNHIEVLKLGYTDGYLPFNVTTRNKIADLIQNIKPSIIFAPDPWYSQDYHPDHINTGRLVMFAMKHFLKTHETSIQLILYYSFTKNRYISVKWKYLQTLYKALSQHQSQVSPILAKMVIKFLSIFVLGKNFLKFRRFTAGYRNQEFNSRNEPIFPPKFELNSIIHRIKYHLFHLPTLKGYEKLHNKSPAEIGIVVKK